MSLLLRHIPLLLVAAAALSIASCGSDEPQGRRPGEGGSTDTTTDTTQRNDSTVNPPGPADTTSRDSTSSGFSLRLSAPRQYAYMGQCLQLTAITSEAATVKWRSTNTMVAIVDQNGLVVMNNALHDDSTLITATANGIADTLTLTNRAWHVARLEGGHWNSPSINKLHPGDTLTITIVDSGNRPIDDDGFNAGCCTWTVTCREADVAKLIAASLPPSHDNGWQMRYTIASDAPVNVSFSIMARYNGAAASISCTIQP